MPTAAGCAIRMESTCHAGSVEILGAAKSLSPGSHEACGAVPATGTLFAKVIGWNIRRARSSLPCKNPLPGRLDRRPSIASGPTTRRGHKCS